MEEEGVERSFPKVAHCTHSGKWNSYGGRAIEERLWKEIRHGFHRRGRSNSTFVHACLNKTLWRWPALQGFARVYIRSMSTQIIRRESREVQHAPMHGSPTHQQHVLMN